MADSTEGIVLERAVIGSKAGSNQPYQGPGQPGVATTSGKPQWNPVRFSCRLNMSEYGVLLYTNVC